MPKLSHQENQARGPRRGTRGSRWGGNRALPAVLCVAAVSLILPAAASATIISTVTNGQLVVQSDGGSVAIGCSGAGGNVKINGVDPGTGPALCSVITGIEVKDPTRSADTFDLSAVTAAQFNALTSVVLDGGENADTLIGSQIADTLKGGGTNDRLIGGAGVDHAHGEEGNDTLVWSPGDGNDVLDGETGNDTAEIDGDGTGEQFTVKSAAIAGRVSLERNGAPQLDIGGTETLDLNTGGGNDNVGVNSAPTDPTDLSTVSIDADGGAGEDTLDGGPGKDRLAGGADHDLISGEGGDDTLVRNPGDGSDRIDGGGGADTVEVNGNQTGEQFTVQPAGVRVAVAGTDTPSDFSLDVGSSEKLDLKAGGGDDALNPGGAVTGLAGFEIDANGGVGADVLNGGGASDRLEGGADADRLSGGAGSNILLGQEGDDTLVWNPGDGSNETMGGNAGTDTVEVNGGEAGEQFTVRPSGARVSIAGIAPTAFSLDAFEAEGLQLNAGGGDDQLNAAGPVTGLGAFTIAADGGPGDDLLNGGTGDDFFVGGDGEDLLGGGEGDDFFLGEAGDDRLHGDGGHDVLFGGADEDTFTWSEGDGNDEAIGEAGLDRLEIAGSADTADEFVLVRGALLSKFERTNLEPFAISLVEGGGGGIEQVAVEGNGGEDRAEVDGDGTAEQFTVQPAGALVRVDATGAAGALSLDLDGTKHLKINAGGGDDVLNASATPGLAGLIDLTLNGEGGNDEISGGDGADLLTGGAGADQIVSRDAASDTVSCGTEIDTASADATDSVDADCETVNRGTADPTSTVVQCAPAEVRANEAITCTVKVKDTAQQNPSTPTEKVAMRSDHGGAAPAPCTLTPVNGKADEAQCELTFTPTEAARHELTATYEGDGAHNSSARATQATVNPRPSATSVACAPASVVLGAGSITCTATVTDPGANPLGPSGTVKFSAALGGFANAGSCLLADAAGGKAGCQVTYTPKASGADKITAAYQGDLAHGPSDGSASVSALAREPNLRFPNTSLRKKPARKTSSRKASFTFSADLAGSTFQCKLDKKPFKSCRSPFKAKGLKPGRHIFQVRASNSAGTDPTPAKFAWRVS